MIVSASVPAVKRWLCQLLRTLYFGLTSRALMFRMLHLLFESVKVCVPSPKSTSEQTMSRRRAMGNTLKKVSSKIHVQLVFHNMPKIQLLLRQPFLHPSCISWPTATNFTWLVFDSKASVMDAVTRKGDWFVSRGSFALWNQKAGWLTQKECAYCFFIEIQSLQKDFLSSAWISGISLLLVLQIPLSIEGRSIKVALQNDRDMNQYSDNI